MRLYNTLTRSEETFAPSNGNTVRMYTCGPTVYARGHIGNFRTFVCIDVLRRTLKYLEGHAVHHVMNFTDIDDRTIAGAQKAGMDLRVYTEQYIAAFLEDARALGLEDVEENPRATDEANLRAMADLVQALATNGHTYVSEGSVYFKISTMPDYGRLARLDKEGMKDGARIDSDNYAKDDARDFVLWKASKPGEPSWDVVDPPGRPGWHLECSAMALRLLGEPPIDIHSGGIDLIFPHHENEIAQSEGATKKPFARFWVHVEHLLVDDEKMSKSLENTYTIPDIVARGYRPSALRYLLLSSHYRKQLNFTWGGLTQAEESLRRLTDFLARLDTVTAGGSHPEVAARVEEGRKRVCRGDAGRLEHRRGARRHLRAGARAQFRGRCRRARHGRRAGDPRSVRRLRSRARRPEPAPRGRRAATGPCRRDRTVIEERNAARRRRDFGEADRIRDGLLERGVLLEDSPAGTRWKRK